MSLRDGMESKPSSTPVEVLFRHYDLLSLLFVLRECED
jgi:hypothetical protein